MHLRSEPFLLALALVACSPSSEPKQSAKTPKGNAEAKAPAAEEKKEAPLPELAGFPLKDLPPSIRRPVASILQEELCGCESTRTLAGCLIKKESCQSAQLMAHLVAGYLRDGLSQAEAQMNFANTITNGHCGERLVKPIDHLPWPHLHRGPPDGPITVVEFVDYLCGHCAQAAPELEAISSFDLPMNVILIPVVMGGNPQSKAAALAALAASRFGDGPFKKYSHLLFKNQNDLSEEVLVKLAKEAGLDVKLWMKDRKDKALLKQFEDGAALANQAGLPGTPYVLINGRPLGVQVVRNDIFARIQLERLRGKDSCE